MEQSESSKSGEYNMVQESKYKALDRYITRAMVHAESVCLLKHKHITPWSPSIRLQTSTSRYWDLCIKRGGVCDNNDTLLDYYLDQSDVEAEFVMFLNLQECIHQINNARSKLKDDVMHVTELRSQFEVCVAIAVVEHERPEFRLGGGIHGMRERSSCSEENRVTRKPKDFQTLLVKSWTPNTGTPETAYSSEKQVNRS
jgi:hypothetical protein